MDTPKVQGASGALRLWPPSDVSILPADLRLGGPARFGDALAGASSPDCYSSPHPECAAALLSGESEIPAHQQESGGTRSQRCACISCPVLPLRFSLNFLTVQLCLFGILIGNSELTVIQSTNVLLSNFCVYM